MIVFLKDCYLSVRIDCLTKKMAHILENILDLGSTDTVNNEEIKMICGLALEAASLEQSSFVSKLEPIWRDPQISQIESLSDELVVSKDFSAHRIGFMLQAVIQNELPDPDSVQWRDLAIKILQRQVLLVDRMYRVGEIHQKEQDPKTKQVLIDVYAVLQHWQAFLGDAVNDMLESDWIGAKTNIGLAFIVSRSKDFQILGGLHGGSLSISRDLLNEAIKFRRLIMRYPSKIKFLRKRVKTILLIQTPYLELLDIHYKCRAEPTISSVTIYPVEKLGTAIRFLLSPHSEIEDANYEIGLAANHMQERKGKLSPSVEETKLKKIGNELERIFSILPARPWPMEGFGSPGVESRFKSENCD